MDPTLLQAKALGPFLCMHRMVHCSSPQTEGIQSSREACQHGMEWLKSIPVYSTMFITIYLHLLDIIVNDFSRKLSLFTEDARRRHTVKSSSDKWCGSSGIDANPLSKTYDNHVIKITSLSLSEKNKEIHVMDHVGTSNTTNIILCIGN